MNLLKKSALAASLTMALCGWAHAASLGQLQVISQADQNFQATFQVHDVTPTGGSLTARLAPAKTYEQYRVTMPESAKGLKLALINKNPLTLRISGDRPAQERSFPLLVELNEAFAGQSIACEQLLKLDDHKVNPRGGAIALGHPVGCSGARIVVTLVHEMQDLQKQTGIASLCVGGGMGIAALLKLPN